MFFSNCCHLFDFYLSEIYKSQNNRQLSCCWDIDNCITNLFFYWIARSTQKVISIFNNDIPLALMEALAPRSAHASPFAQLPSTLADIFRRKYDNSFWAKSNNLGEREREEKKCRKVESGNLFPWQRTQAAGANPWGLYYLCKCQDPKYLCCLEACGGWWCVNLF
jgi:hypothetical protein